MKDRVVQYPNRFKLTPVSGDIYDLTPSPGVVSEEGTDLNKANLFPDDVATALGLNPSSNPQIKDGFLALKGILDEKLLEVTTASTVSSVTLDLSAIDTTQYRNLILYYTMSTSDVNGAAMTLNGITTSSYGYRAHNAATLTVQSSICILPGSTVADKRAFGVIDMALSYDSGGMRGVILNGYVTNPSYMNAFTGMLNQLLPSGITSIELTGQIGMTINSGAQFVLYGVKK